MSAKKGVLEIEKIKLMIEEARRFYWRNSYMKLNILPYYIIIDNYTEFPNPNDAWGSTIKTGTDLKNLGVLSTQYDIICRITTAVFGYWSWGVTNIGLQGPPRKIGFSHIQWPPVTDVIYPGRNPTLNYNLTWVFVHEVQPGDIIVAKRGAKEIVGIGIVTSDCIPPGHSDHPLGDKHEHQHARKVDWRVTESVQVDFNLGGQTVARENRWDAIVEAYQKRGINVYERLWSDQQPRIDVHEHLREDQQLPNGVPSLVRYFEAKGFRFTKEQVAAFYAALKTKGFVILSGLSGTGKTKLAQLFAELLCPCSKCHKSKEETEGEMQAESQKQTEGECKTCTHLFLSVRPDWRDSKALLGYYNPLTGNYESTPLLRFLQQACEDYKNNKDKANPYFVILDEMNLAHVEYYFADFLSVLESGRDEEGWTKEALRLHSFSQSLRDQDGNEIPPTLPLPPNLYIIGTVNIDETTYMFSPKVLDRAFTLEFREVNFSNYPPEGVDEEEAMRIAEQIRGEILGNLRNKGKFCAVVADKDEVRKALQALGDKGTELNDLNRILQPYDLHFGYRVLDEIALFVQNAINAPDVIGELNDNEALDYAVLMKVLPKFHGPRQKLEKPLREVLRWALCKNDSNKDAPSWVRNPDEAIDLRKISEALQNWELPKQLHQAQPATEQAENEPGGRAEQPTNAQQEQGNQTETTSDQATQVEAKGQSGASATKPFKGHFRYPNTAKKVLQMLRQLYETGFASFAQ
ncbi:MAG: hypothetical protein YYHSYBAR_001885 [Candidatus Fervidibacter sacchari]